MNLHSLWPADPRHRRLAGLVAGMFVLAVSLGVHGFSLPLFREVIDKSPSTELIAGHYQWIRGDEWSMSLPTILAQGAHTPKFPVVNGNIGFGQNMLVYPQAPVADFFGLFRPGTWGFFLGPDAGMAWAWWFRVFGLFYAFFLLFLAFSENQFSLSLLSALAFLFAPFNQFWSLNSAEILASMAFSVLLATHLLTSRRAGLRWKESLALWWTGSWFACGFYPAFQVPLIYVALALVATLTWIDFQKNGVPQDLSKRLGLLLGTAVCIAATVAVFYLRVKGPLEILRSTAYPGLRHENGGGQNWVFFFSNFVDFFHQPGVYAVLGNICEAASFLFFFPLCGLALIAAKPRRLVALSPLAAAFGLLLLWMFVGFADPLPALTLLKLSPSHRSVIALGVLNAVLVVIYLSNLFRGNAPRWLERTLLAGWLGFLGFAGYSLHLKIPTVPLYTVSLSALVVGAVSVLIFFRHRFAAGGFLLVSLALTVSFNPVVRGGAEFLTQNTLSKVMTEIGGKDPEGRWLVLGGQQLGNLPRVLGLKSISGLYFYPQFDLWRALDPEGREAFKYNRYVQTEWRVSAGPTVKFELTPPAILFIHLDPKHEVFRRLGVSYFLVEGDMPYFKDNALSFELLFSYADKRIFRYRGPG